MASPESEKSGAGPADRELLPLTAASALTMALAALLRGQVEWLAASRTGSVPGAAAAREALTETLALAARLHMAQLLRLGAAPCPARRETGGAPGSASAAGLHPMPDGIPCRVRGRGQGELPGSRDAFAGGLAVCQLDVRGDAGRDYFCYSVMRDTRMLIVVGRPGTLSAGRLRHPAGAAQVTGRGTVIRRSRGGEDTRVSGRFAFTVMEAGARPAGWFEMAVEPDGGHPAHRSGRVAAAPENLPGVAETGPAGRTPPSAPA